MTLWKRLKREFHYHHRNSGTRTSARRRVLIDWIIKKTLFKFGSQWDVIKHAVSIRIIICLHYVEPESAESKICDDEAKAKNRYEEVRWTIEEEQRGEKECFAMSFNRNARSRSLRPYVVAADDASTMCWWELLFSRRIFLEWNRKILSSQVYVSERERKEAFLHPNAFIKLQSSA